MVSDHTENSSGLIRINDVVPESIVDGPGLRYVVFAQGCPHHCKGCHNPQTHSFQGGRTVRVSEIFEAYCRNPLLSGITFSGGEPFCQCQPLAELGRMVRSQGGTVITYTGYLYEDLLARADHDPDPADLLAVTDLLIDGPYVEALRSLDLPFRGSSNQRLIRLTDRISEDVLL